MSNLFRQAMSLQGHEQDRSNAAPEWQAGSLGWRSRGLVEAYPLEGPVRRFFAQPKTGRLIPAIIIVFSGDNHHEHKSDSRLSIRQGTA
jgi:hypothetical protein